MENRDLKLKGTLTLLCVSLKFFGSHGYRFPGYIAIQ